MFFQQIQVENTAISLVKGFLPQASEYRHVFALGEPQPIIRVLEGSVLRRQYRLETLNTNPDLSGQYLHASIRLSPTGILQIEGILSPDPDHYPTWQEPGFEAIRLQPFFLRAPQDESLRLPGAGLLQRGLHHTNQLTPTKLRLVCVCDYCQQSFNVQHLHAGQARGLYFYSDDSQQTLFVPTSRLLPLPSPSQLRAQPALLRQLEAQLPAPTYGGGAYRYYNPFRCPYCRAGFVDFHGNPFRRAQEQYGCYLLNHAVQTLGTEDEVAFQPSRSSEVFAT